MKMSVLKSISSCTSLNAQITTDFTIHTFERITYCAKKIIKRKALLNKNGRVMKVGLLVDSQKVVHICDGFVVVVRKYSRKFCIDVGSNQYWLVG